MRRERTFLILAFALFAFIFFTSSVSAWWLNGTIYNPDSIAMVNATINVSRYSIGGGMPTFIGSNLAYANSLGVFSLNVTNNPAYMYKIVVKHYNNNSRVGDYVDYTGGILPYFPWGALSGGSATGGINTTFFLKPAGVLNLTAINATGSPVSFSYVIQDIATGDVVDSTSSKATTGEVIVPTDSNYSITIFPQSSMPVSYKMDNFSSLNYTGTGISYNEIKSQLNLQFNISMGFHTITGNLFNSSGQSLTGYTFRIIPYYLVGGMLSLGQGTFPANLGALNGASPVNDSFNSADGNFSMTVPGSTRNATMILLATANKGGKYLIGYRNITVGYGSISSSSVNFTMYPALGSTIKTISQINGANLSGAEVNSTIAEQEFGIFNSTTYSAATEVTDGVHIEASADYTNFNANSFKIMTDTASQSNKFYLPLINTTGAGIKSLSLYSHSYAPASLTALSSPSLISQHNNITLSVFDPQTVGGSNSNVEMSLLKSNTTCDEPSPSSSCYIVGSSTGGQNAQGNPLSAIIGGGKIDFEMGLLSSGIVVKYINVNMIASGPPSAMFDSSNGATTSGSSFSSAMRFGSLGPKIYDYAMVSIPYSTSQLDTSATVNASIPRLYLDNASGVMDWATPVWNTATNGTSATLLAGNYSHFSDTSAWQTLLSGTSCITNVSSFGTAHPCYIDTTNHRIWLRIPHFSGIDPSITGTAVSSSSSSSSSSSQGNVPVTARNPSTGQSWDKMTPGKAEIMKDFDTSIGLKQIEINVKNQAQNVIITVTKYSNKPAAVSVSVNKTGKVYQYFHVNTTNLLPYLKNATLTIRVNKTWLSQNNIGKDNVSLYKFNDSSSKWMELNTTYSNDDSQYDYYNASVTSFSYFAIAQKGQVASSEVPQNQTTPGNNVPSSASSSGVGLWWIAIVAGILIIGLVVFFFVRKR